MAAPFVVIEELERERRRNLRRERLFRDRLNPLELYDDNELLVKYRFDRSELLKIVDDLSPHLLVTQRKGSLPPLLQVMIGLRYLASSAFQDLTGETINVSQPTVSRTVTRVVDAIIRHGKICLPTQREANVHKIKFHELAGVPEVIGCIDGTHVRIKAPNENEGDYVNRKNYHSINVQVMCDANLQIINCVAKWPGSVHDARMLRESPLFRAFEGPNKPLAGILLGDSGYMIRTWLMTPFGIPRTNQEQRFNNAHAVTRVKIENCIGVLKKRWTCLNGLRLQPAKACRAIYACAILHNRANRLRYPEPEGTDQVQDVNGCHPLAVPHDSPERVRTFAGQGVRQRIANDHF